MTQPSPKALVALRYPLAEIPDEWELPEVPVPESVPHDRLAEHLKALLVHWAAQSSRDLFIARNLAIRWIEPRPRVGIDPDLCIMEPAPPDASDLTSLRVWMPGAHVPLLALEIVSKNHPYKDYVELPERYAAMSLPELLVLDPEGHGPRRHGGPVLMQHWEREADGAFVRTYSGHGPVHVKAVDAWFVPSKQTAVTIASDARGVERWLTEAEHERAEKERERAEKEALEARVRELEARLARVQ